MAVYHVSSKRHSDILRSSFREFYASFPVTFQMVFKDGSRSLSNGAIRLFSPLLSGMIGELGCCALHEIPTVFLPDFSSQNFDHLTRLLFYGSTVFSLTETRNKGRVIQDILQLADNLDINLQSLRDEYISEFNTERVRTSLKDVLISDGLNESLKDEYIIEYQFACSLLEQSTANSEDREINRNIKVEVQEEKDQERYQEEDNKAEAEAGNTLAEDSNPRERKSPWKLRPGRYSPYITRSDGLKYSRNKNKARSRAAVKNF